MTLNNDIDGRDLALPFTLEVDGQRIDQRTTAARTFRRVAADLTDQMGRAPKASEQLILRSAATLAFLCDQATARLLKGEEIDEENYRRNAQALGAALIKLGLAAKSRDVTKRGSANGDPFADAINASFEVVG